MTKKKWLIIGMAVVLLVIVGLLCLFSRSLRVSYYVWLYDKSILTSPSHEGQEIVEKLVSLNIVSDELPKDSAIRIHVKNYYLGQFGESKDTLRRYLGSPLVFKDNSIGSDNECWIYSTRYFVFAEDERLVEVGLIETAIDSQEEWDMFRKTCLQRTSTEEKDKRE